MNKPPSSDESCPCSCGWHNYIMPTTKGRIYLHGAMCRPTPILLNLCQFFNLQKIKIWAAVTSNLDNVVQRAMNVVWVDLEINLHEVGNVDP